ncbi:MAG: type III-A CRISPR-associated protein Csm2 [Geminicoccaceae bacterium]|nr:type III-A CRISPR-associated protein Csm2 [Geminicoccaceae bacterium]
MKGKGHQQHASRPGAPGGEHRTQVGGSFGGARAPVADRGAGEESEVAALLRPPAQKETYFAANGKTIRTALLDEEAQAMAEKLKELPNPQLRRFYDPVVALRLRAQAGKLDAEQIKAEMAMMKARAA